MAWENLQGIIQCGKSVSSPTIESYIDTDIRVYFFRHNSDVDLSVELHTPHGWDPRRPLRPHIHVIPMSDGSGNVRISGKYCWARPKCSLAGYSCCTDFSVDTLLEASDQYKKLTISIGDVYAPPGSCEECVLMMNITRPGSSDPADTYSTNKDHGTPQANLAIIGVSAHYEPVKAGTQNEFGPV